MTTKKTAHRILWNFLSFAALLLSACSAERGERLYSEKTNLARQFVHAVLHASEFGGDGGCARFGGPATVSFFSGSSEEKALLERTIQKTNRALAATPMRLNLGSDHDFSAQIHVYYAPVSEFTKIAESEGFTYIPGNSGFFWSFWNEDHEIVRSVVLIANDYLYGSMLESVTLEELTQSLGPAGDQSLVKDSIFYETSWDPGFATEYSELDVQTLQFLYRDINPGDTAAFVDRAFNLFWIE